MADSGGGRSCGVCKRTLQPGDEWIALDGGEIWCAECWQQRFALPAATASGGTANAQSPAGKRTQGTSHEGSTADTGWPCMDCGHLCLPTDAACPACGGPIAAPAGVQRSIAAGTPVSAAAGTRSDPALRSLRAAPGSDASWYYLVQGQQVGPVPTAALAAMMQAEQINLNTLVWRNGMDGWKPASLVPELAASYVPRPAPATVVVVPQSQGAQAPSRHRGKSKVAAGILALFVGGLGIHKFYLGGWGWGLLYILFVWTFIPAIVSFIEGIILLTMSNEAFDRAYNYGEVSAFTW